MARPALPRGLRVFLDAVRGLAALEVVAHHLVSVNAYGGPVVLRDVFAFGQEAVMVFFLLSGFVVYANEFDRRGGVGAYLFRRLRRIYPPLVLALVLSIGVAAADRDLVAEFHPGQVLGTLVALQDNGALKPGVIVDPPFHNLALWSLSYEIAFYLVFPLLASALHRWPRLTPHLVGAVSLAAFAAYRVHPGHAVLVLAYLLVWWAGAAMARAFLQDRVGPRALAPELLWLTALTALAVGTTLRLGTGGGFAAYPLLMVRHFGVATALVTLVAVVAPTLRARPALAAALGRGLARVAAPSAFLASISYGLYVFHWPLLVQWGFPHTGPVPFAVAAVTLLALAVAGDRWAGAGLARRHRRPVAVAV
ncbi:acyltransferase [Curtobacterium sp. MCBD17_035]|uniref:acyltransferase family protein n=1 Tax=Curtobacterium sp. MCBD17_035 TaxID=2175673 RepID=UPI000DA8571C|nr:acyltransferase [Curtobacterium sp. MCBD17_035]WIB68246.1 acyltransferase [Curtobacterium sp. MCBD17_035]